MIKGLSDSNNLFKYALLSTNQNNIASYERRKDNSNKVIFICRYYNFSLGKNARSWNNYGVWG